MLPFVVEAHISYKFRRSAEWSTLQPWCPQTPILRDSNWLWSLGPLIRLKQPLPVNHVWNRRLKWSCVQFFSFQNTPVKSFSWRSRWRSWQANSSSMMHPLSFIHWRMMRIFFILNMTPFCWKKTSSSSISLFTRFLNDQSIGIP